ncbi:MAG: response regulator transcription factor [Bacteroidetes bacterium]|nr:MAG: response regulator transcription factor [Bacteroidota bacterium]
MATTIRVLVVDDHEADLIEEFIQGEKVLGNDYPIKVYKCPNFDDALKVIEEIRIDFVVLDLKDDDIEIEADQVKLKGEEIFDTIKTNKFLPVVFYSAYAHKVKHLENSFVKVLVRGEGADKIRGAIKEVFDTKLVQLVQHIQEEQRNYLWDQVLDKEIKIEGDNNTDIAFLLSRRLSNILERGAVKRFLGGVGATGEHLSSGDIHPVEMYVYPPVQQGFLSGDILKCEVMGKNRYCVILTPSCDLQRNKHDNILLANCQLLEEQPEFIKLKKAFNEHDEKGTDVSNSAINDFKSLVGNNRKGQDGRYFYLPGTSFLPSLIVDFQETYQIPKDRVTQGLRIASLDSPFSEELVTCFNRHYGRVGTPDLDKDEIVKRVFGR